MARGGQGEPTDWVTRAADDAVRHAGDGNPVTVSSGVSPSGPVHLGNLREFLTVHFVADELRRRGTPVRHLHVWDDFDRFRRVPGGVDPEWSEHIGRPLSAVPDPWGCHDSWAEHFKEPLRAALADLGVEMEEVSQTERYRAGVYRSAIRTAIERRDEIEAILARHRTRKEAESVESDAEEEPPVGPSGELARFPFKPYCSSCGRDTLDLTDFTDPVIAYTCRVCGYHGRFDIDSDTDGKLVWKVDWPMRWAFEHVDFEPAGMDHATPGSSFTVGHELVDGVFGMPRPAWFGYAFVGFAGVQKMSSSTGVGRPPPPTRCGSSRRRSCAGSTSAGSPGRRSTSTSGPRWSGCTTSGTRLGARLRPSGTSRCWPSSAPPRPQPPAPCRPRAWWCRSGRSPRSPT